MYLARSLSERQDPGQGTWARAAYREYGKRWSLDIAADASSSPDQPGLGGRVALEVPNFYPEAETSGLPVYDVGMVWARALWMCATC